MGDQKHMDPRCLETETARGRRLDSISTSGELACPFPICYEMKAEVSTQEEPNPRLRIG